ncbi:MAG: bifunctional oligoribonuclease/PAP phosphatase NrnA [Prevotella sp.]
MHIDLLSPAELQRLRSLIVAADNIVVCCHVSPDGDALGSSLAWAEALRQFGKNPVIIVPDQFPDFLRWLPCIETVVRYDKRPDEADAIIADADLIFCLDFNELSRTDDMQSALSATRAEKVLVDHHLNPLVDAVLSISRPSLSSTSEMVFRLAWQLGLFERLDRKFAVPVYCGMMTDTGGFTFNSNAPEIFFIICQLLTKGIDKDKIYRNVYNVFSEHRLRLQGFVLYEKMVVIERCHAAFFTLTREDLIRFHYVKGDGEGLVNMPLQIKGMRLSISLREDTERDNYILVSLRSVDDFPCNEMAARFFNGGGHKNASGGKLFCSIEEAVDITRRAILAYKGMLECK